MGTGQFPKMPAGILGRKLERVRFPRRSGKLDLWAKANSAALVAGIV